MRVAFVPVTWPRGRSPTVVTQLPLVLTRSSFPELSAQACTISQPHCEIDEVDGLLVVRDLGSRHGTFVNRNRVTQAPLWPGDRLTLGVNGYLVFYDIAKYVEHAQGRVASRQASGSFPQLTRLCPDASAPSPSLLS